MVANATKPGKPPEPCEKCTHRREAHIVREGVPYCVVCNRRVPEKGPCGHPTLPPP
jgi:hypothetical protein